MSVVHGLIFIVTWKKTVSKLYPIDSVVVALYPHARQACGLFKLFLNCSSSIKFLIPRKVFMAMNLIAAYVKCCITIKWRFRRYSCWKTNRSKECMICHHWYIIDRGYKYEPEVCYGCLDILMMMSFGPLN